MTNPDRLYVVFHCKDDIAVSACPDIEVDCDGDDCNPSPVAEYVLASVAEDGWSRFRQATDANEALRRERDALAAEADGLRKHIAAMVDLYERATTNDTDEMPADDWAVYQAARAEMPAAKGVG